jgi:CheY-like chemotaxis protein
MMPVASGDLVLGFIRSTEKLKKIPVLVVSAHANIAALAEQYEADAYLQKPFSPQDLRFVMQQFLTKE